MQEFPSLPNIKLSIIVRAEETYGIMQRAISLLFRTKGRKTQKSASKRSWLAGRECKPGSTQIRMILNRNITNISKPFCYFLL
jgi:hypothetical protein